MLFCASEVLKKQTNKKQNIMDIGLIQQSTFLSDSCGGGGSSGFFDGGWGTRCWSMGSNVRPGSGLRLRPGHWLSEENRTKKRHQSNPWLTCICQTQYSVLKEYFNSPERKSKI